VARRSLFSLIYESASRWMNPHEKLLDDDDDLQGQAQAKN
jgi:hypothetical protein